MPFSFKLELSYARALRGVYARVVFASLLWFLGMLTGTVQAQSAWISGKITDQETGEVIEVATIYIDGSTYAEESKNNGNYRIRIPAEQSLVLVFTRIGYKEKRIPLDPIPRGERRTLDVQLELDDLGINIEVKESQVEDAAIIREQVEALKILPTASGNFESVLPQIALGTSSGSGGELTSQYNVRGGNYDENLVYVNDFEIYRPQLIRAGQQEGLTFPNIDLIRDLQFSSGGFAAKYGDKLSSVLDIKYKRPDSTRASISFSLLGGSAHVEGAKQLGSDSYKKFRYLIGGRYKSTQYLLGSLQFTGEYTPNFTDVQGYFTYDLNRDWQLGYLVNYNRSQYNFVPEERSTATGLVDFALRLFAVFEGEERDRFTTGLNGLSLTYIPERDKNPLYLKFLASHQFSNEREAIDIIGGYRLSVIETNIGEEEAGEDILTIGTGIQHQHVRNFLRSNIANFEHKGGIEWQPNDKTHFVQWGAKVQYEDIFDRINEWERLDSAGFSLPYDPTQVLVRNQVKSQNKLTSLRFMAYVQDAISWSGSRGDAVLSAGVRVNYWDLNGELIISPRGQFLYKPTHWDRDISFKLSAGIYSQPPFYREMRRLNGVVNRDLLAQKALHIVGGFTHDFIWGTKNPKTMKLITEVYYKSLWDLVTFDIENVRIRYSGENEATGYAMGLDVRLNGEFVPGAESWINLSLLRTRESINGIDHIRRELGEPEGQIVKDVPRPTDQLGQLAIFFQDYLPRNENFKVHLNFTVGTGLPFGLPNNNRIFRNTYRFRAYHRTDMGFSLQLWNRDWRTRKPNHLLRSTDNAWVSLEVFNLMNVFNVASNTWIKSIYNVQYAIPNFLTTRRVNLRFRFEF